MKDIVKLLYDSMMQDCAHCREKHLYIIQELECCFQICTRYWSIVRDRAARYEFDTVRDEIDFFKNVKPLFTSEIEYLGFVSFAEFTKEKETDPCELKKFWAHESLRLDKFIKANKDFHDYFKNGRTDKDKIFFTRENNDLSNFLKAKSYDLECRATTSHDHLVASILALEKYQAYLQKQRTKDAL